MQPVSTAERITAIDILRGAALFGILAANMRGFFAPGVLYFTPHLYFTGGLDRLAQALVDYFVQGKFVTLFSILFGIGFAIQMDRAAQRGTGTGFYKRRLGILLVFGLVHGLLIWWGDILAAYALTGFVLLLFRRRQQGTLVRWMVGLYVVPFLLLGLAWLAGEAPWGEPPKAADIERAVRAYRDGPPLERVMQNLRDWARGSIFIPLFACVFGLPRFLAGLWLWRTGLFADLPAFASRLRRVQIGAGAVGIVATLLMIGIRHGLGLPDDRFTTPSLFYAWLNEIAAPALAVLYGATVLRLSLEAEWRPRLAPFGHVGRMALTNYLAQSLLGIALFQYTGMYGRVGPAIGILLTFALYAVQVWFSRWWLQRYRFGPAEWLWRRLTYGEPLPMRRESARASAAARSV